MLIKTASVIGIALLLVAGLPSLLTEPLFDTPTAEAAVSVRGYYRKNGTYVRPHYRSNPDGNPYNNWSFPGNTNPYTGITATGNPSTYLRNYNRSSTYTPSYGSLSRYRKTDYGNSYDSLFRSFTTPSTTSNLLRSDTTPGHTLPTLSLPSYNNNSLFRSSIYDW